MSHANSSEFYRLALTATVQVPLDLGGASQVVMAVDTAAAKGARITNVNNPDTDQYFVLAAPDADGSTTPIVVDVCDERLYVQGDGGICYLYVWVIKRRGH